MDVRTEQFLNASTPILVTDIGIETEVRLEPLNAFVLIVVIESWIETEFTLLLNEFAEILTTLYIILAIVIVLGISTEPVTPEPDTTVASVTVVVYKRPMPVESVTPVVLSDIAILLPKNSLIGVTASPVL